jgi:hypothetical protein
MENGLEGMYVAVGVIMFVAAISILYIMNSYMNNMCDSVLYRSIDSAIMYEKE